MFRLSTDDELRLTRSLVIGNRVAGPRQGDDDVTALHFDVEVVGVDRDAAVPRPVEAKRLKTQTSRLVYNSYLLHVADVVDADDVLRGVPDRLIARDVRLAQDGRISVVRFASVGLRERRAPVGLGWRN